LKIKNRNAGYYRTGTVWLTTEHLICMQCLQVCLYLKDTIKQIWH